MAGVVVTGRWSGAPVGLVGACGGVALGEMYKAHVSWVGFVTMGVLQAFVIVAIFRGGRP